jgi:acyl carrier protein
MDNGHNIKTVIKEFILNNFPYSSNIIELTDDLSFTEKGIIDSTGILELIDFMEERFKINIENGEVVPDNLDSLSKIERYIKSKTL